MAAWFGTDINRAAVHALPFVILAVFAYRSSAPPMARYLMMIPVIGFFVQVAIQPGPGAPPHYQILLLCLAIPTLVGEYLLFRPSFPRGLELTRAALLPRSKDSLANLPSSSIEGKP